MCTNSKSILHPFNFKMEHVLQQHKICTNLLELAAVDDLAGFIHEIEEKNSEINEASFWYGRSFGSKKMGFEKRTPIMIASLYGSTRILNYIIKMGKVNVNEWCSSDRVTPLHCAAAGGSLSSLEAVKLLIDASADINAVDANGIKPIDLITPFVKSSNNSKRKAFEMVLNGDDLEEGRIETRHVAKEGIIGGEKEYPVDISLPDINNGLYRSDEFRMYYFKVKPCSRAYSHDWTECPFVHPGENARRRDPTKFIYTCAPCPEFKKGSCGKGDSCEYAHGVFESWLHPAQYRTRLCKDETGCSRRVCFFAHKPEELRPLYASTGSGMPSPKSDPRNSSDLTMMSPVSLSSSPNSSPISSFSDGGSGWHGKAGPPVLQLPVSRLRTAFSARDVELDIELASLSSPYGRVGDLKPTNLDYVFGSTDHRSSPKVNNTNHHLRASYPSNNISARKPSAYGFDSSAAVAAAVMNSRTTAFSRRSQSFVDRAGVGHDVRFLSSLNDSSMNWGSPDGKLDWGFNGDEMNKLRKSASFGIRSAPRPRGRADVDGPDVSWVNSLVKDAPSGGGVHDMMTMMMMPNWIDQMHMDHEQMVA